ncbi:hypothetical protein AAZX31_03G187200 [Glycine max]|nr:hypothetical protein GLYMA_03G207250v4 [Glycine max]KAH1071043.1 hypothetical protein GYH30_007876 [Glycine max]
MQAKVQAKVTWCLEAGVQTSILYFSYALTCKCSIFHILAKSTIQENIKLLLSQWIIL